MKNILYGLIAIVIALCFSLLLFYYLIVYHNSRDCENHNYIFKILKSGNCCIWYDNIIFKDNNMVNFLLEERAKSDSIESFSIGKITPEKFKIKEKIDNNIFRIFAEFPSVNQWSDNRKEITTIIDSHELYFCGIIKLSDSFNSFVFKMTESSEINNEDYFQTDLFILNMAHDTITSISRLYSYIDYPGFSAYTVTSIDYNCLRCRYKDLANDNIIVGKDPDDEVLETLFLYDQQGRIVILH